MSSHHAILCDFYFIRRFKLIGNYFWEKFTKNKQEFEQCLEMALLFCQYDLNMGHFLPKLACHTGNNFCLIPESFESMEQKKITFSRVELQVILHFNSSQKINLASSISSGTARMLMKPFLKTTNTLFAPHLLGKIFY